MRFLAVNGSPRRQKNTGQLLEEMTKGAAEAGAKAELVHLRDLEPLKGCISCFHCKNPESKHYGHCVIKDTLTPLLAKAAAADVLVLGTPIYFAAETAMMRCFTERLYFQYHIYSNAKPPLSKRKKAGALVYTMNIREEEIPAYGYDRVIAYGAHLMEHFFAPCEVFLCTNTKQFGDYAKYEVDVFDVPEKLRRHEEVFPQDLKRAFELGKKLVSDHS